MTVKSAATPRWVSGMPATAGAASAEVIPGTTVTGTPAAAHASHSSPPRPNTNGSPPLRRTTRFPARARSTSTALISSCVRLCRCADLPQSMTSTCGRQFVEQLARREPVHDDDIGVRDQPPAAHRDQIRVARAAADERHRSGRRRPGRPGAQLAHVQRVGDRIAQRDRAPRIVAAVHGDGDRTHGAARPARARCPRRPGRHARRRRRGRPPRPRRCVHVRVGRARVHQPRAVDVARLEHGAGAPVTASGSSVDLGRDDHDLRAGVDETAHAARADTSRRRPPARVGR